MFCVYSLWKEYKYKTFDEFLIYIVVENTLFYTRISFYYQNKLSEI